MTGYIEDLKLKGRMLLQIHDKDGNLKEERQPDNLIVDAGFDLICDAIGKSTSRPAVISHIAVGTGAVVPAAGDTTLGTEIARLAATYAHTGGTKIFDMSATFAAGTGTGAITESGILNAASTGTLLDRVTFAVVNKGSDDSMTVKFTFTLS